MKKFKNLSRKSFALLIALVMCLSLLQLSAFAAESQGRYCIGCREHEVYYVDQVDPTCEEEGIIAHYACSNCGRNYYLSAVGTLVWDSNKVERIPALGHDLTHHDEVDPTCTEEGNIKYWYCETCEKYFADKDANVETSRDAVTIPAVDHKWDDGVVTKEPTATEEGEMTYTCEICRETTTEAIPATGESESDPSDTDCTCGNEDCNCEGNCECEEGCDCEHCGGEETETIVAQVESTKTTYETLQAAINAATEEDTVTLLVDVTENVTITNKSITLDLGGNTVTGTGEGTVVTINGGDVTLTGKGTITGGESTSYGGGVWVKNGNVTIDDVTITGNTAAGEFSYGGGVYAAKGTELTIKDSSITNNTVRDYLSYGGGVYAADNTELIIKNSSITNNTALGSTSYGGGVYAKGALTLDGNTITNNRAEECAGGVYVTSTAVVVISGNTITDNNATWYAGVYVYNCDQVTMTGNTISKNTATYQGGGVGIHATGSSVITMKNNDITNNTANNGNGTSGNGGGISVGGTATLSIIGGSITGNAAAVQGGGIYVSSGTAVVTMDSVKLYSNTAGSSADDVYAAPNATLTLPDAAGMGATMSDGKDITGWFADKQSAKDGPSLRWRDVYEKVENFDTSSTALQLKAAHDEYFTVTYTDGADGSVFDAQSSTLEKGTATPAFDEGTLTREGYTFTGWSPEVVGTVIANVTYVAQWTEDVAPENPDTNPEGPGTTPEGPGTNPEDPGTNPENPGTTTPENPGTNTPVNPGTTTPENPGTTTPVNPGTEDSSGENSDTDDTGAEIPDEDVPLAGTPETDDTSAEFSDEDVPLAGTPELNDTSAEFSDEDVPLAGTPETDDASAEFSDEDVPLAGAPDADDISAEISDEDVPLADNAGGALDNVPQTGDITRTGLWCATVMLSAFGLAALVFFKKRENQEN